MNNPGLKIKKFATSANLLNNIMKIRVKNHVTWNRKKITIIIKILVVYNISWACTQEGKERK